MNRYISVLGLAARSCFLRGLAVMVAAVALAGVLLYLTPGITLENCVDEYGESQTYEHNLAPSELPGDSKAFLPLALGLIGLCTVLAKNGGGKDAKPAYTVRRLRVKPGAVRLLWTGYYFMMLILYWALAAAVLYGVMRYRVDLAADTLSTGPQSLVLAFYGSRLLHHLLPVGDIFAWCANIVGILACAVGCMDVAQKEWSGQIGGPLLGVAVALTLGSFRVKLDSSMILVGIMVVEAVVVCAAMVSWSGGDTNEEGVDSLRA